MAYSSLASQIIYAVLVACITSCILLYFRVKKREIIKKEIVSETEVVAAKLMSNNTPQINYDVFVSFRGEDIRHGFLSHLTKAFTQKQIHTFVDDKLKRGDDISSSLFEAIEGSSISLIIFSENYASSPWCLKELVKILECKETYGQIVLPVFYKIEPSDVRHQKNSYENALLELEKMYDLPRVQIWRQALNTSANLSGITSLKFENDADLLEQIINRVLVRLRKYPVNTKGLIGIEKPTAYLESLLCKESIKACVIGIWGMGGIGKTTIAEDIFNKKCFEYGGSCFLLKVKDELQKHGIQCLKEKLFSKLLAEDAKFDTPNLLPSDIQRRIGRMKVLIVLDDVNDKYNVASIFGTLDWLHSGSRIIITTRDKQVLISNKADDIYHVGELSSSEALELFNMSAFNQSHLENEYSDLSQRVVNYAKGIPLVLKVLGGLLCGKGMEVWESQLDKLNKISIKEVHSVMRLSYDDLDPKEKMILLDIACFFGGMETEVSTLIMLLKDHENDNSVVVGLERLKDRALVTIKDDIVSMHEIIHEMGFEIVRQESENPGHRSRLWDRYDICEVLENNKGTDATRSIIVDCSLRQNHNLSRDTFVNMSRLQFLLIYGGDGINCPDIFPRWSKVWRNLKLLFWVDCRLKSFPRCISVESLVMLCLSGCRVHRLWQGVKNLANLKKIEILNCFWLEELPDLSKAINLEYLKVDYSVKLKTIHPSIYSLKKLQILRLKGCVSLTKFTSDTRLSSMYYLNLTGCTRLKKFLVTSENITQLHLEKIPANALPSSFACQSKLEKLYLSETKYESLPYGINKLTRLRLLDICFCAELVWIPVLPPSLEELFVGVCRKLQRIVFPSTAAEQFKENRKNVVFSECFNLNERSLRGIELNAQINLMKRTYQHSSTSEHDDDDYNEKYGHDKDEDDFDRALYVYPGVRVPKWLQYKTTKDEMIIDLSTSQLSPLLGFIFCFILVVEDLRRYAGPVKFEITIVDGEGKKGYMMDSDITTGHVCLTYDKKCSRYLTNATKNQTRLKIKVATRPVQSNTGDEEINLKLIEFGVNPVNTLTYDSFIQRMRIF